jgi:hypothetical protein
MRCQVPAGLLVAAKEEDDHRGAMTAPARRAQADHPVRARAQRHGRLAGAQSPAVIGTHVHAVGDVTFPL